jgi:hypothetical protein
MTQLDPFVGEIASGVISQQLPIVAAVAVRLAAADVDIESRHIEYRHVLTGMDMFTDMPARFMCRATPIHSNVFACGRRIIRAALTVAAGL